MLGPPLSPAPRQEIAALRAELEAARGRASKLESDRAEGKERLSALTAALGGSAAASALLRHAAAAKAAAEAMQQQGGAAMGYHMMPPPG